MISGWTVKPENKIRMTMQTLMQAWPVVRSLITAPIMLKINPADMEVTSMRRRNTKKLAMEAPLL
jgi:hypothetical protein